MPTNSQEPGTVFFGPLEPEPLKKIPGAGAGDAWEKNQEPDPLEKKSGAGAAKKCASSLALVACNKIYI